MRELPDTKSSHLNSLSSTKELKQVILQVIQIRNSVALPDGKRNENTEATEPCETKTTEWIPENVKITAKSINYYYDLYSTINKTYHKSTEHVG